MFIPKLFCYSSFDEQRLFSVKFARFRNFFDFAQIWANPLQLPTLPRQFVPDSILGLLRSARISTAIFDTPLQPTEKPCSFQN